jgi:hypothetical protein
MGPRPTWCATRCETRWDACPGTRNFGRRPPGRAELLPKKPAISAISSLPAIMSRRRLCEGGSRTTDGRGDGGAIAGRARSTRLQRGGRGVETPRAGVTQRESRPTSNECERTAKPRSGVGAASPRLPFPMLRSLIRPAELGLLPEASLVLNMPVPTGPWKNPKGTGTAESFTAGSWKNPKGTGTAESCTAGPWKNPKGTGTAESCTAGLWEESERDGDGRIIYSRTMEESERDGDGHGARQGGTHALRSAGIRGNSALERSRPREHGAAAPGGSRGTRPTGPPLTRRFGVTARHGRQSLTCGGNRFLGRGVFTRYRGSRGLLRGSVRG